MARHPASQKAAGDAAAGWSRLLRRMVRCETAADLLDVAYDHLRRDLGYTSVSLLIVNSTRQALVEYRPSGGDGGASLHEGRVIPLSWDSYYTRLLTDADMQADGPGFVFLGATARKLLPLDSDSAEPARGKTLYVSMRTAREVLGFIAVEGSVAPAATEPLVAVATALAASLATLRVPHEETTAPIEEDILPAAALVPSMFEGAEDAEEQDAGVASHSTLLEEIDGLIAAAVPFTLLLIDIDNFSLFNETYGHRAGDRVLDAVAMAVRAVFGRDALIGRYGHDEFAVAAREINEAQARALLRRVNRLLREQPYVAPDLSSVPVSVTCGVASYPARARVRRDLIVAVGESLAAAKRGRAVPRRRRGTHDLPHAVHLTALDGLVTAVNAKDRYTREHSDDVTHWALTLAEALGLDAEQRRVLATAGPLHDVGKIAVPDRILRKPGRLTQREYDAMKHHVAFGVAIVRGVLDDPAVIGAIACHHERWDGMGYPHGYRGAQAPLLGRIMALADAVSAMRQDRPYRQGLPWARIVREVRQGAGGQFDPELSTAFIDATSR